MGNEQLAENARAASALLKSMCNESRLMILCQLLDGEKSVGEIEKLIGISQSALSQHLARLRHNNLVETRRQAQIIYYRLHGREVPVVLKALYELFCAKDEAADGQPPCRPNL